MSRHVWLRFLAGVFLLVCAPVFGLVETDNPLLGVLREQDFNVIQDLGFVHAKAQGLPGLEIRDGADSSAYDVSCKLNTMLYSGTHKRGLARFVAEQRGKWQGMKLEADPDARFMTVSWVMTTGRDPAAYRRQLNEWKRDVAGLNAAIYRTLDQWGPDPAVTSTPTPLLEPRQGDVQVIDLGGGVTLEMVWVEPGTFMMGSPANEPKRGNDETQHKVTLTKGFWLGKHEVTQEQWETIMGSNPSYFKGARNPVEQVSWNDCQDFIKKLNSRVSGGGFRLPTEAEWEFAARGGTRGRVYMYSGGNYLKGVGWYGDNSGSRTHAVGQKRANELGLYDMSGNVSEWCVDWYGDYSVLPQTDPTGLDSGSYRVVRGGGWYYSASCCRLAIRNYYFPNRSYSRYGFRLARSTGR